MNTTRLANCVLARVLVDLLDDLLAALVLRVRLAGEHELHGPLGVVEQLEQPLRLAEEQAAALVRGEAAREADGQDFRVEDVVDLPQLRRAIRPGARAGCGRGCA